MNSPSEIADFSQDTINKAKILLDKVTSSKGKRTEKNTLETFNKIMILLSNADDRASLYSNVHPVKDIREAYEKCEKDINKFFTELTLNQDLFQAFTELDTSKFDNDTQRLVKKTIEDFKRDGVDRDEATRNQIRKLKEEIVEIGIEFGRNIREDIRYIELDSQDSLQGLPEDYIKSHQPSPETGKIRITIDYPDSMPFMQYAKDDGARKRLLKEQYNRGYPNNIKVLKKLLEKRHQLATLLGYPNWAAYVSEDKMIKTEKRISDFIDNVANRAQERAQKEKNILLEVKRRDFPDENFIGLWQRAYYEQKVRAEKYTLDSKEVRRYFPVNLVKAGVLKISAELFDLVFNKVEDKETWHPSVEVYRITRQNDTIKTLGYFYFDLHPRDGKYKHAAQFTLKSGISGMQAPEGVLVCNFPEQKAEDPGLMEHSEVVTFFHEFGHLMHHILAGNQKWKRFSGVTTEWDFVEVPSQLLEEWAWDTDVLQRFALHYQTNKPIPKDLVKKMREADRFGVGLHVRQQMFYAAVSLGFHNKEPSQFDELDFLKTLQEKYSFYPYIEGTNFHTSFNHLYGYSAIYYTYMWSLVITKDILGKFRRSNGKLDLMNKNIAAQYRDKILVPGGSRDAADLVVSFLGREFTFDEFAKWLSEE